MRYSGRVGAAVVIIVASHERQHKRGRGCVWGHVAVQLRPQQGPHLCAAGRIIRRRTGIGGTGTHDLAHLGSTPRDAECTWRKPPGSALAAEDAYCHRDLDQQVTRL